MKILKRPAVVLLTVLFLFSGLFFGCNDQQDDIIIDDNGNIRPGVSGETTINFWGWGDQIEVNVFTKIVQRFNQKYAGVMKVNYIQKPSNNYGTSMLTTLAGSKTPDVFYVQDNFFKQYASQNYLLDLSDYYAESTLLDEDEMFPHTISRYRYNTETTTSNPGDPLYGVPKDLAPTVIYYNKTQFIEAGVTLISMTPEEALSAGKTVRGYDAATKTFNNKIPMNWSECVQLSQLLMSTGASQFGFFSEWWFNYGWSVGGDCIEYLSTSDPAYYGGYYKFTLSDSTKNYIVKDDFTGTLTVNGNGYTAGQIIAYADKTSLTPAQKNNCNELPSTREAFTEFVRLSQKTNQLVDNVIGIYENVSDFYGAEPDGDLYGYGITPNPTTISSDGKVGYFTSGKVGMLVATRSAVRQIRDNMSDDWDVAPMLVYKEYNGDGTAVTVHGVEAAHSNSVAICVSAKTKIRNAAWKFAEFIASAEGQTLQAEEGFAIPLQKSVANSDVFLQPGDKPANSSIFIDACYFQTPGDWWYLKDKKWIDDWAHFLNGTVRNGKASLTQFYNDWVAPTDVLLLEYTKKSNGYGKSDGN
jgi:multiple sugar transport system substrate-binding protein